MQQARTINAFKTQDWNVIKSAVSWVISKVMRELIQGFEKPAKMGSCVTILSSDRTRPDHKYFKIAEEVAMRAVQLGYEVTTRGNPAIMESGNEELMHKMESP